MERNELGGFCESNLRGWSLQAVECYRIGSMCEFCDIPKKMTSQKCQMKATVLELTKLFGRPNADNTKGWSFARYERF